MRGHDVMGDEQERLMEIFNEARAKASVEERDAYLMAACSEEGALHRLVKQLLEAHEHAGDFLEHTVPLPQPKNDFEIERTGVKIGRYKLLERIGEGGFGVVFMAEQEEPIRRRVALKIIKAGMDTKEVVARFDAERQALALMDHPNIASVLDAGTTAGGRPYFVMELVNGIPITEYCDRHNLAMPDRLGLFMQVCHAVQHAHQKGIIHRDLKPGNVPVTTIDGKPVPKIIDFGVAKALGQKLTEKTLFTSFQTMIGTPTYMSPEQAELSGVDVDTRSDIYSLGVLLYELLTGVTPFDAEALLKAGLDEVRRIIRETEPPKPSTRLRTLGNRLTEVAAHRHTEPSALSRQVHGDMDWIVMKALEKERSRRYATAEALVEDLQRHLNHQPVLARPPSTAYRARKFVRRHHVGVALSATAALALLMGFALAVVGFLQARYQRDRALKVEEEQREILECLVNREMDTAEIAPLLEGGARIAKNRQGPDSEAYIWFLQRLAPGYGSMGDWDKALELYQILVEVKPDNERLWWSADVAAMAAGKLAISRELSAGMLARFGNSPNPWASGRVGYIILLSSDNPSDLQSAEKLVARAFKLQPHDVWAHIIAGVSAYRMTNYVEAETHMEQARSDPDPAARCVGAYYLAMMRHHQGETGLAKQFLEEGNRYFNEFLGTSDLRDRWQTLCENIFIRAKAERLILGRETSPPVTAETMAAAYQSQKQVATLLANGYALATERKWKESANAFAAALRHPALEWVTDARRPTNPCLGVQMAVAFVKAGDFSSHERLCRYLLAHQKNPSPADLLRFVEACFVNGHSLPADIQQRGIELARSLVGNKNTPFPYHWTAYSIGIAEYRAGDYDRAMELLQMTKQAQDPYGAEIVCRGGGMVFQAMALEHLGRETEARDLLAQARKLLTEPIQTRSGAAWWDLDICELALEEASQLIEEPSKP